MRRCDNARALLPRPKEMARILGRQRNGSSREPAQTRQFFASATAYKSAKAAGKLG